MEYPHPLDIMAQIDELNLEIAGQMEELRAMLEEDFANE